MAGTRSRTDSASRSPSSCSYRLSMSTTISASRLFEWDTGTALPRVPPLRSADGPGPHRPARLVVEARARGDRLGLLVDLGERHADRLAARRHRGGGDQA